MWEIHKSKLFPSRLKKKKTQKKVEIGHFTKIMSTLGDANGCKKSTCVTPSLPWPVRNSLHLQFSSSCGKACRKMKVKKSAKKMRKYCYRGNLRTICGYQLSSPPAHMLATRGTLARQPGGCCTGSAMAVAATKCRWRGGEEDA